MNNKQVTDEHINALAKHDDELAALRKGLKEVKDSNDAQDITIDKHSDQLKNHGSDI